MADLGAEPRLVVPEGLMIDESARERLTIEGCGRGRLSGHGGVDGHR